MKVSQIYNNLWQDGKKRKKTKRKKKGIFL